MESLTSIITYIQANSTSFIIPFLIILYVFYYRKYSFFKLVVADQSNGDPKKPRGSCPPFFPNGWYRISTSNEIKAGEARSVDCVGRNVVLFRGTDNIAYVLDAYCAHMGANLGVGGKVKHTNCVECPFHGWTFEGSTGKAVLDSQHTYRSTDFYDYNNGVFDPKKDENGSFLKKCGSGEASVRKYEVREINGFIMVYFDCREEYRNKPPFEPLIYEIDLKHRGESAQFVNCHVQEIPENGADVRHFDYVHLEPVPGTMSFMKFRWGMKTKPANDPDLYGYMKHERKFVNDFKQEKMKKYITEENKNYSNVISLDCFLVFFGKWEFFFFNATGLQTGPSQVLLFLISSLFEVTFLQHVIPMEKFMQKVYHNVYSSSYLPYWLTALMLRLEVQQVLNDTTIWNKKTFGMKLSYNMKNEADRFLMNWRNWYAQFYAGGKEFQEKNDKLGCPPASPKHQPNHSNHEENQSESSSFYTFNNLQDNFYSVPSEIISMENNENNKNNENNEKIPKSINEKYSSFQSFDHIDYLFDTSLQRDHEGNEMVIVMKKNVLGSDDLYLENNRFYKKPKELKTNETTNVLFCSCFRKKGKNLINHSNQFSNGKLTEKLVEIENSNQNTDEKTCVLI